MIPIPKWYVDQYYEDVDREERELSELTTEEKMKPNPMEEACDKFLDSTGLDFDDLIKEMTTFIRANNLEEQFRDYLSRREHEIEMAGNGL